MFPDIAEVKLRRVRLGLTQSQLSSHAHVSQSLIAKIESGRTMPSYDTAKKIFETLEAIEKQGLKTARDCMNSNVVYLEEDDLVEKALHLMKTKNFSQLPVMRQGLPIGSISETTLLDKLTSGVNPSKLSQTPVREVMSESFPVIEETTPFPIVSSLLTHSFAVLVKKKQKVIGIISRTDVLSTK